MIDISLLSATSDELSAEEFFLRISPPDRFQVDAMLDILEFYGWNYFAIIHDEVFEKNSFTFPFNYHCLCWLIIVYCFKGLYGENGGKYLEKGAKDRGLCVASSDIIYHEYEDDIADYIIPKLIRKVEATHLRVVILFMDNKAAG